MKIIGLKNDKIVKKNMFGGKAYWLSWLSSNGYTIPETVYFSKMNDQEYSNFILDSGKVQKLKLLLEVFRLNSKKFGIAVRSSAINEDSSESSYAGHYKSFVGNYTVEKIISNIEKVIGDFGAAKNKKMAVVLQRKINSLYSGVVFSSNPLNNRKDEMVISLVKGMGENLVSGKVKGEDIVANYSGNELNIPKLKNLIQPKLLRELCSQVKKMENQLGFPVDVEWCIEKTTNKIYIVQCRPITTISTKKVEVIPINLKNESLIPPAVIRNDKVQIRFLAQKYGIDVSNAYLLLSNGNNDINEKIISKIKPEKRSKGFSIVLIHPKTIDGKIIRKFAEREVDALNHKRPCQRYGFRTYENYKNLINILKLMQSKCFRTNWNCVIILQEIFQPEFTGIVKKLGDEFIVEIARGHFIPKGIVETSQYTLNKDCKIVYSNEVIQSYSYEITKGVAHKKPVNEKISLDVKNLKSLINKLEPLLSETNCVIEFGLLKNKKTSHLLPYLIDLVDDKSTADLSSQLISQGVISPGMASGKIHKIVNSGSDESLNLHFHDVNDTNQSINDETIFVANTPDIALLKILKNYNNKKIGFVFKEGSILSHFSILLREKGIPAVIVGEKYSNLTEGEAVKIDAFNSNLNHYERITKQGVHN
ncbi:MAG: hypothetical protein K1X86_15890 [Ignavibacteria bacterium]|nr:hypothetical protein [Ignavibacteria bacterium]